MQETLKNGKIHTVVRQDVTRKDVVDILRRAIGPIDFFIEFDRLSSLCTIEYYGISQDLIDDISRVMNTLRRGTSECVVNTRRIGEARSILEGLAENWTEPIYVIPGDNSGEMIVGSDDRNGVAYVIEEFSKQCGF